MNKVLIFLESCTVWISNFFCKSCCAGSNTNTTNNTNNSNEQIPLDDIYTHSSNHLE